MSPLNIVIVCFKYPPVYSGYGKQLKLVINSILRKNNNIKFTILTAYKESKYENSRIQVIPLLNENDDRHDSVFPFSIEVFKWLKNNRNKYDLIHSIKAGPESVVSNIISKLYKIPLIIKVVQEEFSLRDLDKGNILRKLRLELRYRFLGTNRDFVAISDEIEENISRYIKKNGVIHRVPNGVDNELYNQSSFSEKFFLRNKLNLNQDELIVLYVGAINKRKGIPELIEATNYIDSEKQIRFVLCGPVLEDIDFEKNVNSVNSNINKVQIDYRGKIDNPDEYMKSADVFILPSHSEGLPNVLLEAASCGLPLIATDIGGSREIVSENENGYLIEVGNAKNIAEACLKLIMDEKLRMDFGNNSRILVDKYYALSQVAEKYLDLYYKLVKQF